MNAPPCTQPEPEQPMAFNNTLPDNPVYAFIPSYDIEDGVQNINIVFKGLPGHVPTSLVTLTIEDAEHICDRLNRNLGFDRAAWTAIAAEVLADTAERENMH